MELNLTGLTLPVRILPAQPLTEDELMRFSRENRPHRIERDEKGNIILMSPTGLDGSAQNFEIAMELGIWNRQTGERGVVIKSNGGFTLPDTSVRAADAAWVSREQWDALDPERRKRYGNVTPEFVIELLSPSDSSGEAKTKMEMWMRNGVELAWLIDPFERSVVIYRWNQAPERLDNISQIAGEGPVAGFVLPLDRIFGSV